MTATAKRRKVHQPLFQVGQEVQINSSCFVTEWIGAYVTVTCYASPQPGKAPEVWVRTKSGRELVLYETSLTAAD